MPIYPSYDTYELPRKNVFVISCIDLRLTDDLVKFLNHDNLTNRYDHYIAAGTSICTCAEKYKERFKKEKKEEEENPIQPGDLEAWTVSLFSHLRVAIALHKIKDVYIIEHEDCGAYKALLNETEIDTKAKEIKCHEEFAEHLQAEILKRHPLNVHCFILNLRGDVTQLAKPIYKAPKDDH